MCFCCVGIFRFPSHWFWRCFVRRNHNVERKWIMQGLVSWVAMPHLLQKQGEDMRFNFFLAHVKVFPCAKSCRFRGTKVTIPKRSPPFRKLLGRYSTAAPVKLFLRFFKWSNFLRAVFFAHLCEESQKSSICVFRRHHNGVMFFLHCNRSRWKPTTFRTHF